MQERAVATFDNFGQARERFQASYNGANGEHLIADSAEVQRV
ncbi:putative alpha/beta hydrolase [Mycolicibacterium mengxianglii]